MYEPRKANRRRKFYRSISTEDSELEVHRIEKRDIPEQQVVSITLGVRGLMVGSDNDLGFKRIVKRDIGESPRAQEKFPSPGTSTTTIFLIASVLIILTLLLTLFILLRVRRSNNHRVIEVSPQLK